MPNHHEKNELLFFSCSFPFAGIKIWTGLFVCFKLTNQPHLYFTLWLICCFGRMFSSFHLHSHSHFTFSAERHFLLQTSAFSLSHWFGCHQPLPKHQHSVTGLTVSYWIVLSGDLWEGTESQKGPWELRVARKPFCCISPPLYVSFCPLSSSGRQWEGSIFKHLKILSRRWVWPQFRGDLFHCHVHLCCFYGTVRGKKGFSSGSCSAMKGATGECHTETHRRVRQTDMFGVTQLSMSGVLSA